MFFLELVVMRAIVIKVAQNMFFRGFFFMRAVLVKAVSLSYLKKIQSTWILMLMKNKTSIIIEHYANAVEEHNQMKCVSTLKCIHFINDYVNKNFQ